MPIADERYRQQLERELNRIKEARYAESDITPGRRFERSDEGVPFRDLPVEDKLSVLATHVDWGHHLGRGLESHEQGVIMREAARDGPDIDEQRVHAQIEQLRNEEYRGFTVWKDERLLCDWYKTSDWPKGDSQGMEERHWDELDDHAIRDVLRGYVDWGGMPKERVAEITESVVDGTYQVGDRPIVGAEFNELAAEIREDTAAARERDKPDGFRALMQSYSSNVLHEEPDGTFQKWQDLSPEGKLGYIARDAAIAGVPFEQFAEAAREKLGELPHEQREEAALGLAFRSAQEQHALTEMLLPDHDPLGTPLVERFRDHIDDLRQARDGVAQAPSIHQAKDDPLDRARARAKAAKPPDKGKDGPEIG